MAPLISVVVPAFNRANTIARAIQSIQMQTYTNWEAIIVDDGSIDSTSNIVQTIAEEDKRIRLIRHQTNCGAQAARNTGIKSAKGAWISFLDSDDEFLPNSLEVRLTAALKNKVAVVHSGSYILMNDQGLELYRINQPSGNVYASLLANENPMFPALMVSKYALEQIGYLDETIVSFQEWDTFIRLAKLYKFAFLPEPTFVYDYRTQNAISRNNLRVAIGYRNVMKKHFFSILAYAGPKALYNHCKLIAEWYEKAGYSQKAVIFHVGQFLLIGFYPQAFRDLLAFKKRRLHQ